jgi:hypothetical protein
VAAVAAGLAGTDPGQPLVLVAHSNAGVFVPVIERGLVQPVACSVFADAAVPAARGHTPTAGEEFLPFLRSLADPDGRLPRWTDWWDEDDVAPMFPSPQAREVITGEQPRLPLAYYQEQVPAPAGWDDHSCGYLLFSPAYQDQARQARQRGWPVQSLPGEHLHQIVDPDGVAHALLDLVASTRSRPGPAGVKAITPGRPQLPLVARQVGRDLASGGRGRSFAASTGAPRTTATSRPVTPHRVDGRSASGYVEDGLTLSDGEGQEERTPSRRYVLWSR